MLLAQTESSSIDIQLAGVKCWELPLLVRLALLLFCQLICIDNAWGCDRLCAGLAVTQLFVGARMQGTIHKGDDRLLLPDRLVVDHSCYVACCQGGLQSNSQVYQQCIGCVRAARVYSSSVTSYSAVHGLNASARQVYTKQHKRATTLHTLLIEASTSLAAARNNEYGTTCNAVS